MNINKRITLFFSFTLILIVLLDKTATAQYSQAKLDKSREINSTNYKSIKGDPYLYEDFMYATFFGSDTIQYQSEFLNYNGYEETFEVLRDGKKYNFSVSDYDSIVIHPTKNDSLLVYESFARGVMPADNSFANLVYHGTRLKLIREFKVKIDLRVTEAPGGSMKSERFTKFYYYSMVKDLELTRIRIKKSDIIDKLGHEGEVKAYLKKEKISISDMEDLKKFLAYYEQNLL